ncbi:hypothetical protein QQS21_009404 [Conoideocrella luteorostrata]|uniref:Gfd2/YDR514C-like C-terminal domain-containing protein n=1 Tax=Conoideocrella luteorostrata TaxID=1105319 RepID=A0AAJ0CJQ9_9HYPO|nr:hypothetical protein QQS21_009404 [Conoideocrella luteorostrata]
MADSNLKDRLEKLQNMLNKRITLSSLQKPPELSMPDEPPMDWQEQHLDAEKDTTGGQKRPLEDDECSDATLSATSSSGYRSICDDELFIGQPVHRDVKFCSFKQIQQYPEQFIGRENRPRVKPYFARIFEDRVWHFFSLHWPGERGTPRLLVPTTEFLEYLDSINQALGTKLQLPSGPSYDLFNVTFGLGSTPRPRYVGTSECDLADAAREDDIAAFKSAGPYYKCLWEAAWQKTDPPMLPFNLGKAASTAARKQQRIQLRKDMLSKVRKYLNLESEPHQVPVVFISIDIENLEDQPHPVTEIGIAALNTTNTKKVVGGLGGAHWWTKIVSHHLIVRQYAMHVNRKYVQGCPDMFQFGQTEVVDDWHLLGKLRDTIAMHATGERDVVLVGHGIQSDIAHLSKLGFNPSSIPRLIGTVDTQSLHQVWKRGEQPRRLDAVLSDLCIRHSYLHNAGNDATYTLRALVTMAVEGPMPEGETWRIPQLFSLDDVAGLSRGDQIW